MGEIVIPATLTHFFNYLERSSFAEVEARLFAFRVPAIIVYYKCVIKAIDNYTTRKLGATQLNYY